MNIKEVSLKNFTTRYCRTCMTWKCWSRRKIQRQTSKNISRRIFENVTTKWTISVQQLFNRAKISEVATVKTKGAFHLSELTGQAIPVVTLLMPVKKKNSSQISQILNSMHKGDGFSVKTLGKRLFHFQNDWSDHGPAGQFWFLESPVRVQPLHIFSSPPFFRALSFSPFLCAY